MKRKYWKPKDEKNNLQEIAKIGHIAQKWKWKEVDLSGNKFVDVFYDRLSKFDSAERSLILRLTENFLLIEPNDISREFFSLFNTWASNTVVSRKNITICPLLAPKDFGKQKSSTTLWYNVDRQVKRYIEQKMPANKLYFVDTPKKLDYSICANTELLLIDDFVGTGNNAYEAIIYLTKLGWDINHIYLLSIVMMSQGKQFLESNGIKVETQHLCNRGITDSDRFNNDDVKIMEAIECKLQVSSKFQFGYGRSEALVSMLNTPNNTFPFYWWDNKNYAEPPFCRG